MQMLHEQVLHEMQAQLLFLDKPLMIDMQMEVDHDAEGAFPGQEHVIVAVSAAQSEPVAGDATPVLADSQQGPCKIASLA